MYIEVNILWKKPEDIEKDLPTTHLQVANPGASKHRTFVMPLDEGGDAFV